MNFFDQTDEEQEVFCEKENDSEGSSKGPTLESGQKDSQESQQDYKDRWLRAVAETENLRRRHEKEKEDVAQYAFFGIAKDLLSVVDTFQRALEIDLQDVSATVQPFIEGIQMTEKELMKVLGKFGVEKIQAMGVDFDPHLHQAIGEEVSHHHAPGTILKVLQEGYLLKGRLLRPALVFLAKASS